MKRITPNADQMPKITVRIDTFFGSRIYEQHMWLTLAERLYTNQSVYWYPLNVLYAGGFHVMNVTNQLIRFL